MFNFFTRYSHRPNISFNGPEVDLAVQEDVVAFREAGGGCIVENTTHGIKRNLPLMGRIAGETGVKVVAGAGGGLSTLSTFSKIDI